MQRKLPYWVSLSLIIILSHVQSMAQVSDSTNTQSKKIFAYSTLGTAYVGGFTGLYFLWYDDYKSSKFRFFDDFPEWGQMDKVGHVFSAYAEAKYTSTFLEWAGHDQKQAALLGSGYSFLFQSTVEVLDGYSDGWGFSVSDIASNFLGTGAYLAQDLAWSEQRFLIKYSYRSTPYPAYRPSLLGSNFPEKLFKDYNAQTYWLSFCPTDFVEMNFWPEWLGISLGYGIDGFVGARDNCLNESVPCTFADYPRIRQFYLSPDINLERIPVDKKWLKVSLSILNNIKFPLPSVGYNSNGNFSFNALGF